MSVSEWVVINTDLQGLKHLHDNQLCHLDIKPANIFLGQDNFTCKIGDFGLCSNVDQGLSNAMEGDAKYLAPELMGRQFGKPADIFRCESNVSCVVRKEWDYSLCA